MARTVSQILLEDHSISIRPGAKGKCPFCDQPTFSVKGDDSLGKCFHPACGRFLVPNSSNGQYVHSLTSVVQTISEDFRKELLGLDPRGRNALTYLRDERGIHPQVISDALLGAIPSGYDLQSRFQDLLDEAQQAVSQPPQRGRPRKQQQTPAERLQFLQEAQEKLRKCLEHHAAWLAFFYTDATHRIVQIRFRQPFAKQFVSFKPYASVAGVFGRELFTPYVHQANQALNDFLLVLEGEFNVLQLQSLILHYEAATGQTLGYVNACAVGSVLGADAATIQRIASRPVIVYDNDANGAGFELVKSVQKVMPVEACTTPDVDSDLDNYICGFRPDAVAAWQAVQALIAQRQPYGRIYSGTGAEFFESPVTGGKPIFIPRLLGEAIMARNAYRYAASQLWVYRDGVYLPCGEATLRAEAQALLGNERQERRIEETLKYVEVATRLEEESLPDCQYINLRNGRLDWATGTLEPHTSAVFATIQLPVHYDPTALCPAFDHYLSTTFDADVHPLIEELLGWCLVPTRRFETAVMFQGEGANGKTVFLDTAGDLLGEENIANVALQDLEENRFRVAELYGKLANIFADLDARGLKTSSMFKTLTTGDLLTAERKHGHPFRFRFYGKLLFSANKIPSSRDRTHAFYRRWIIIPFTRTFDGVGGNPAPDRELRDKLKGERSGILNRALRGLERLALNDAFTEPQSVLEAKKAYIRSNDNVREFVTECVNENKNNSIEKQAFYKVYENWCDAYGVQAVSQTVFKDALKQAVPTLDEWRPSRNEKWRWLGIDWSADASPYF
jgi:putative DNA primase/helicase